jgi:hypothetical protein
LVLAAMVNSTIGLYLTYGRLGGIGTGIIYVALVRLMVLYLPEYPTSRPKASSLCKIKLVASTFKH